KNIRPWMWSRCRCVRRMCTLRTRPASAIPNALIPVPASRITSVPSPAVTCTHDVFPPNPAACGPGTGTDPRTPQNVTRIESFPAQWPEPAHPPVEPARADERERDDLYLHQPRAASNVEPAGSRSSVTVRPCNRKVARREMLPDVVERADLLPPSRQRDR